MTKLLFITILMPFFASAASYECESIIYNDDGEKVIRKKINIAENPYESPVNSGFYILAEDIIIAEPGFSLSLLIDKTKTVHLSLYKYLLKSQFPLFASTITYELGQTIRINKAQILTPEANIESTDVGPFSARCEFIN